MDRQSHHRDSFTFFPSTSEDWEEFAVQMAAAAAQQPVGSSGQSGFDSHNPADFIQSGSDPSVFPCPERDNLDHRGHSNPHGHAADPYNNSNINNPYNYGGGQQQPAWPVQTPVTALPSAPYPSAPYPNPPNALPMPSNPLPIPPNTLPIPSNTLSIPPHLTTWPIYSQGQIGSSSHANPPPTVEVPPRVFQLSPDPIHQKLNRGRRKIAHQHTHRAVASRRQSNKQTSNKQTSAVPPSSIPPSLMQIVILTPQLIEEVKAEAHTNMVKLVFENTFWPADETLAELANEALETAVTRRANVELHKWRRHADGISEIKKLNSVPTTIINDFKACGHLVVFVAYDLAFPIAERGVPVQSARINTVDTLLQNDSFLDGILNLPSADGTIQSFVVPLANRAIINLLEIVLLEQQYYRYIFDGSDKWKLRLTNAFSLGGTVCRWGIREFRTGVHVASEFDTSDNAEYFEYLTGHISQFDARQRSFFDGLLVDEHFVIMGS